MRTENCYVVVLVDKEYIVTPVRGLNLKIYVYTELGTTHTVFDHLKLTVLAKYFAIYLAYVLKLSDSFGLSEYKLAKILCCGIKIQAYCQSMSFIFNTNCQQVNNNKKNTGYTGCPKKKYSGLIHNNF